jgi:hypothetical protein
VVRRLRTVLGVTACAAVLAACGGDGGSTALPPPPSGSTAVTAAPTTPAGTATQSPEEQVLAGYQRFWDAVVAAHEASDPRSRALAAAAADPELARVRAAVARNGAQQLSLRGEVGHAPRPAAVTGSTATLDDCYDISRWNPVNRTTGERVEVTESGGTGRYRARYTLRRSGSGWIVVDQKALGGC